MQVIEILLLVLKSWLLVGFVFGLVFVVAGIGRVHEDARGSGPGFRLIVLPGCTVFWPWLLWLWVRRRKPPVECTYHRCAVPEAQD